MPLVTYAAFWRIDCINQLRCRARLAGWPSVLASLPLLLFKRHGNPSHSPCPTAPLAAGGVAALLTLLLVQEGLPPGLSLMHCVTLGSAAVLSASLAEAAEELITSVVVG